VTSQDPTRFDNYPPEPDPRASGFEEPSDDLPRRAVLPPPPDSHVGRRVAIGLLIGVPALSLGLVAMNRTSSPSPSAEATAAADPVTTPAGSASTSPFPDDSPTPTESWTPSANRVNVGGHTATVPKGWTIFDNRADEAGLSNGSNRVVAYQFFATDRDKAEDLIGPLTRTRLGAFKGKVHLDDHYVTIDEYRFATLGADGTVHGKKARMDSYLWIDPLYGDSLLVVEILTAMSGSEAERGAFAMLREFFLAYPL